MIDFVEREEADHSMLITFYLKSGVSFDVAAIKLEKVFHRGRLVQLIWNNSPDSDYRDLSYVDVQDISAITIMR